MRFAICQITAEAVKAKKLLLTSFFHPSLLIKTTKPKKKLRAMSIKRKIKDS